MSKFVPSRKAADTLGLHPNTLRRLADSGKIEFIKTPSGQRHYNTNSFIGNRISLDEFNKRSICYCRVSSQKQSEDLKRQIEYMRSKYPNHENISDIGSSLNYNRKGLSKILELASGGQIKEVVVAHKDRLGRFGVELIQRFIELNGGKLVVLNNREVSKERELSEDLIRIITFYSARYHGSRRYSKKAGDEAEKIQEATAKNEQEADKSEHSDTNKEGEIEIVERTRKAFEELVRCLKANVQSNHSYTQTNDGTQSGVIQNEVEETRTKESSDQDQETRNSGEVETDS